MSTKTRNLVNIDGANVTNPDANNFTANQLEAFANDAAFEAQYTPGIMSMYWNTTTLVVRQYDGTGWQNNKVLFSTELNSALTGADADLTPVRDQIIKVSNASLTSIRNIVPTLQKFLILINGTGVTITIKNEGTGTAANRILTGNGTDLSLANNGSLLLAYDGNSTRWRVVGGAGGGGLTPTSVSSGPFTAAAGFHYLTNTTSGAFTGNLPAGTTGATIKFTDANETWATNNFTITPATGEKIDQLAINESLVCDVIRGWVELNWTGAFWAFNSLASTNIVDATNLVSGKVNVSAQSFAGLKTFYDGLKLDDAVGNTALTHYSEDDLTMFWDPNGTGVDGSPFTLKCTRIGRIVTLTFPRSNTATGAGGTTTVLTANVALGSIYRPTVGSLDFGIPVFSNGATLTTAGMLEIATSGSMIITPVINGSGTFGTGTCGNERTAVSYSV